jgi:hypothetical protein
MQNHSIIEAKTLNLRNLGGNAACWQQYTPNFMQNADGHWWSALAVGLIPIPIGWLIGSMLIFTGRWIGGGFEKNSN